MSESIFKAFNRYKSEHQRDPDVNHTPLFQLSRDERKAAIERVKAAHPSLFADPAPSEREDPIEHLNRAAEYYRATPITQSGYLIRKYGHTPTPTKPAEDRDEDREAS